MNDLAARPPHAVRPAGATASLDEPGGHGLPASTPITGEVLFTVAPSTAQQADDAMSGAAQAFSAWRSTRAPVRGALVAGLGELLTEHKNDLATLVALEV